jgi:hypothetical protein
MTFYETITEAVKDIEANGFDSMKRVEGWVKKIKQAAIASMVSDAVIDTQLRRFLKDAFFRFNKYTIPKAHKSVSPLKAARMKPTLQAELDRRMMASLDLIKINREETINKVLQRFKGWATSVPNGGSNSIDKLEVKDNIRESLASLDKRQKRVFIDQSHKLTSALNNIVAKEGGAIAVKWKSQWRSIGYNYREDHKLLDGEIFLIRDSWAKKDGLVKPNENGYYEDRPAVGEEINCRCKAIYIYSVASLPDNMKTKKYLDRKS